MVMTLDEFAAGLRDLIGQPTPHRPFVCQGSPLDCRIALVGFNPATAMEADFWSFWREGVGYDRDAWFQQYLRERAAKPLDQGRTRRLAVSPTRRNIHAFIEGAGSIGVLETNLYSLPSVDIRGLATADRDTAPFRHLLNAIRPRVIVAYGRDASEAMDTLGPSGADIIKAPHLRLLSREAARDLGRRAAAAT